MLKNPFIANCPKTSYFFHLDPATWSLLQQRFTCESTAAFVSDIWDGEEYRKHQRFLSNPANVSLLLNTDGVNIFRSSKCSLWPIWLVINELPPSHRYAQSIVPFFVFNQYFF